MGFFDKLFEKKECSICGGEIGLLGNRKLEDGNCCMECAGKLSPWFDDRRHSTVAQIAEQLKYREENKQKLASFRPMKTFGERAKIYVEYENGVPSRFAVTRYDDLMEENADLISFKDVISFQTDIREDRDEIKRRNSEGEEVSYNPPRYTYSYDFKVSIQVNNPYFDDINIQLNSSSIELESEADMRRGGGFGQFMMTGRGFDPSYNPAYREFDMMCRELEEIFALGQQGAPMGGAAAAPAAPVAEPAPAAPAGPKFCPNCGAPAEGGKFCQSCGSPLQ